MWMGVVVVYFNSEMWVGVAVLYFNSEMWMNHGICSLVPLVIVYVEYVGLFGLFGLDWWLYSLVCCYVWFGLVAVKFSMLLSLVCIGDCIFKYVVNLAWIDCCKI